MQRTGIILGALLTLLAFAAPGRGQPTVPKPDPRDHGCPWLDHVFDDEALPTLDENWEEFYAYNYLVLKARQFTPEQMAKVTRKELTWRMLFGRDRARYRGEIAHVKGWLKRLVWIGSNKHLEAEGVKNLYEAWIFDPDDFRHYEPTCVILSELPPGLEPVENNTKNVRVAVDGYFFKRYKYRAVNDTRLAPLVIGRTLTVLPPPAPDLGADAFERLFLPVLLSMVLGMVVCAFVAHYWFRTGDRRTHDRLRQAKETEWVAPTDLEARADPNAPNWN